MISWVEGTSASFHDSGTKLTLNSDTTYITPKLSKFQQTLMDAKK